MHRRIFCVCDCISYYFFTEYSCYSKACKLPSVAAAVVVVEFVKETSIYVWIYENRAKD